MVFDDVYYIGEKADFFKKCDELKRELRKDIARQNIEIAKLIKERNDILNNKQVTIDVHLNPNLLRLLNECKKTRECIKQAKQRIIDHAKKSNSKQAKAFRKEYPNLF